MIGVFQKFLLGATHQRAGLALMKTKDGFAVVAERNGVQIKGSLVLRFKTHEEVMKWQGGLSDGRELTRAAIVANGLKRLGVAQ